jgi:magnesium-transporting ATPase (P-type)
MSLPVTPIQILWVNMVTAVTLGIALAFEPTEDGTMRRPPRPRNKPLLTGTLLWHIILVATLLLARVFGIWCRALYDHRDREADTPQAGADCRVLTHVRW